MNRVFNFFAGPSTMPLPVLEKIQKDFVEYPGIGMSLMETSHRSKTYDEIHNSAISNIKELLEIPDNFHVMFLGGGATLQFTMVPMNLVGEKKGIDMTLTGAWAKKALADARKVGEPRIVYDGAGDNFTTLPEANSMDLDPNAAYVHVTSNETIGGVQWKEWPDTGNVPLVADMSSDILSRRLPMEKFGLVYAGAQKNLAPAGVTLVIIRDDVLASCRGDLPAYLGYKTHAPKNSLYNTPPVFPIYAIKLVTDHVKEIGGMDEMERRAQQRADAIYGAMDDSNGFYRCPVDPKVRSLMNIVWRLPTEELEKKFIAAATEDGMVGLKGHRDVGGCRASVYNAMPVEGALHLAQFMADFAAKNG